MTKITVEVLCEFLYFYATNYDRIPQTTRIVFATFYIIIMVLAAVLNFTILHVFITRQKLRRPSNVVLSPLLWNSLKLLLSYCPLLC